MEEHETDAAKLFEGWVILELYGHRRLGGYATEQEIAGKGFLRIDVPGAEGPVASQFYAAGAIFSITPTTEEMARAVAASNAPRPVHRWELPRADEDEDEDEDDVRVAAVAGPGDVDFFDEEPF